MFGGGGAVHKKIGRTLGREHSSVRKHIMYAGGKRPVVRQRSELRLSLAEREEIARGLAAGRSLRQIAAGSSAPRRRCARGERQRGPAALSGVVC